MGYFQRKSEHLPPGSPELDRSCRSRRDDWNSELRLFEGGRPLTLSDKDSAGQNVALHRGQQLCPGGARRQVERRVERVYAEGVLLDLLLLEDAGRYVALLSDDDDGRARSEIADLSVVVGALYGPILQGTRSARLPQSAPSGPSGCSTSPSERAPRP